MLNDGTPAFVELQFCPSPELIPIVRRFVSAFYEQLLSQPEAVSRLALAAHELLENTVKFSVDRVSSIQMEVVRHAQSIDIGIRTRNRASAEDLAAASTIVDELRGNPDPFAYYQQVIRANAKRREGSGLGLARICAEADMSLDCEVEGDELIIVASARFASQDDIGEPVVPEVSASSFTATSSFDGRALTVRLTGNAELGARAVLESLLPRVHAEALRLATPEVVVDLTSLEFMSSSCFRTFVTWLSDVQDLPPERQYRIRLRSNASMLWQRRSLHALRCFAHELVDIEI